MIYTIKFTTPFDTIEYIEIEANTLAEAVYKADHMTDICDILTIEVKV